MKSFLAIVAVSAFIVLAIPVTAHATKAVITVHGDPDKEIKMLSEVTQRVIEIQAMDKTNLTSSEKKALRKELLGLKKKADSLDQRVYLSIGALIIIILLLILILR